MRGELSLKKWERRYGKEDEGRDGCGGRGI